ncbi:MAG: hypothetical protein J7M34_05255, partial [Anaerolineae bacterium]|nr:hypothetical protein [Anaerolineae bacterium]
MYSLERCLVEHPLALLRVIAQLRGVKLHARKQTEIAAELAAVLSDPGVVARDLTELSQGALDALDALAASGGRIHATLFQERYGEIRFLGPGRLTREQPWESPTGPAEELWYRGWIFRGFAELEGVVAEIIFLPEEILALLPRRDNGALSLRSVPPPSSAIDHRDALVQDITTMLALILVEGMRRRGERWHPSSLRSLSNWLMVPPSEPLSSEGGGRLALLLHLMDRLDWCRESDGAVRLRSAPVSQWLEAGRASQWKTLWTAWQHDDTWSDLRRLPGLICEGGWREDPVGARRRLLARLGQQQPGEWYRIDEFVAAVQSVAPDFLRPDGDYDSWYIRSADSGEYLRGIEHWDDVEGRLIRYLVTDPLHWFGVDALAPDGGAFAVTEAGHALINDTLPPTTSPGKITVMDDFTVLVPQTVSCYDRLRVARFTAWMSTPKAGSSDPFRYRITRTGLRRAEFQGIPVNRVLAFLRDRAGSALPENVARALERWPNRSSRDKEGSWIARVR